MKKKLYHASETDLQIFAEEAMKYRSYFGLLDWEIGCQIKKLPKGHEAEVEFDFPASLARLSYAFEWDEKPTEESIRLAAFHEICEVMFAEFIKLICESRSLSEDLYADAIEKEKHAIIHILEEVIFKSEM